MTFTPAEIDGWLKAVWDETPIRLDQNHVCDECLFSHGSAALG